MNHINRIRLINSFFQKKDQLVIANTIYRKSVENLWKWLTTSDDVAHDITTTSLSLKNNATATIVAKQKGSIAGLEEIVFLISSHIDAIQLISPINDGNRVKPGDTILKLSGPLPEILAYERTILNILGRMSGIATETNQLVSLAKKFPHAPCIAATRKTPWTLLDKKAVSIGGGLTHRLSLSDSILIKDNHLEAIRQRTNPIQYALKKAFEKEYYAEIEVKNSQEAHAALIIFSNHYLLNAKRYTLTMMLDNWTPGAVQTFIKSVKQNSVYESILFEASGDITEKNVKDWSQSGVDILSLGALTHSPKNFNLSMKIT